MNFFAPLVEILLGRLDPLSLLAQAVDKCCVVLLAADERRRRHLARIANNHVIDVVIVDDVGYVASGLVHTNPSEAVLFCVRDR